MSLPSRVILRQQITLTPQEHELFEILKKATSFHSLKTTLRVAGGWVRDKLLQKDSDDIDIALDDMMGCAFAEKLNEYLRSNGEAEHKIAKIMSNPEQSKHLETARVRIKGTWIDLVNLRSETYSGDSRIPHVTVGTPLEDALRRDFTINSLFYNINNNVVEDFTEKGYADLMDNKIIRTPLPPSETFRDDPLRIMRAVRFAARFNFKVADDAVAAARDPEVQHQLNSKISRERIGTEICGIVEGPDPLYGLFLIDSFNIGSIIFNAPESYVGEPRPYNGLFCVYFTTALARMRGMKMDADEKRITAISSYLLRWTGCTYFEKKDKSATIYKHLIFESLRLKQKDWTDVHALSHASEELADLVEFMEEKKDEKQFPRCRAGLILRGAGPMWRVSMLLAALHLLHKAGQPTLHFPTRESLVEPLSGEYHSVISAVFELERLINLSGLEGVWNVKPLLNGNELIALGVAKGPGLSVVSEQVLRWQLEFPDMTSEGAADKVKESLASDPTFGQVPWPVSSSKAGGSGSSAQQQPRKGSDSSGSNPKPKQNQKK